MIVTPSPSALVRTAFAAALLVTALLAAPAQMAQSALPALESRVYVANDEGHRIDVFDVGGGHAPHHSITPRLNGRDLLNSRCRGLAAHAASERLYFTDSDQSNVVALDLTTEKVLWERRFEKSVCEHPDRLSVTSDGRALYVPCKLSDNLLVLDARDGSTIKTHTVNEGEAPHNTYTGERGDFMYLGSYRSPIFRVYEQRTHEEVRRFGGFSSGIRPFAVDPTETYVFANLTTLLGFAVGDVRAGRTLYEVEQKTPAERLAHPDASGGHPHGGSPKSHGLALRPGTKEVWFLDDEWGYLYVYDASPLPAAPPKYVATVPLFTDISKPYYRAAKDIKGAGDGYWRWLTFSIDGRWAYPGNGAVVDAERRALTSMRVTPSEKQVEVGFSGGRPVVIGGQNGGLYRTLDRSTR
jgi:DNA-binding beta-propeller fold protein YncE